MFGTASAATSTVESSTKPTFLLAPHVANPFATRLDSFLDVSGEIRVRHRRAAKLYFVGLHQSNTIAQLLSQLLHDGNRPMILGLLVNTRPCNVSRGLRPPTPNRQANMRRPHYTTHSLRLRVERRMAEESSDEGRHFVLSHAQHNQAVAAMAELPRIKIVITSEERDAPGLKNENKDLIVLQTFPPKVNPNLAGRYSRYIQEQPLTIENVLVKKDQAWTRSSELSVTVYSAE